jgi:phosphate uptake regulator
MKRKLIRQGAGSNGSFTLTLPAGWVRKHGLNAGDEIDVEEHGNALLVGTAKGFEMPKEARIDLRNLPITHIWRKTAEAYRSGAETIILTYENKTLHHRKTGRTVSVREEIERVATTECLGMEIEKITPTTVTLRQFGETLEGEFDAAFRKILFKLQDQAENAVSALTSMKPDDLRNLWIGDRTVNRFCNFCMRILNKKGSLDPLKMTHLYAALVQLEELGDLLYLLGMDVAKYGVKKVSPDVIASVSDLKAAIKHFSNYFYDHKDEHATAIMTLRDNIYAKEKNFKRYDTGNIMLLKRTEFAYDLLINLIDCAISVMPTLGRV